MPAPSGRTVIRMSPVIAAQSGQQATVDSAGRFVFKSLGGARHRISINGLTAKYYVKEIRYDGLPAADGFITPAPGAVLEIIIDDKPAILTGTVSGLDKPGSRVLVMAVRWPLARDQDGTFPFMSADAAGERQGKFQISGLAPGEYRVLALPPGGTSQTHMESFIRLEARAQAVTLDRGGSQDITIKLAEP